MSTALETTGPKSFWKKPEGTTGKVLLGAGAVAGGLLVFRNLPEILAWINLCLENTIYMIGLGAGLLVVSSPVWSSKVRALTGYMVRSGLRALTGFFVQLDPIGILKSYVEDLVKSLTTMDQQIGNLRGHVGRLKTIIAQNEADRKKSIRLAGQAQQTGEKAAFTLQARRAGRREQSNVSLQALLNKMEALLKLLSKLREVSDVTIQDMTDEVQTKETERKAIIAGSGALTSAMKIMRGDPDKRAIFDQAMEYLAEDYAKKVGEIEEFMTVSQGFIASVDLENGIFEEDALHALEAKLDDKTEKLLLAPINKSSVASLDPADVPETSKVRSLYE